MFQVNPAGPVHETADTPQHLLVGEYQVLHYLP